ncbi:hypothetical protein ACFLYD_02240 [Chloroflexota bacterium]
MSRRNDASFPILNTVFQVIAIPYNFAAGFILGLAIPLAAIAAMVAGIRLLTGRVPFPSPGEEDEEGERQLSVALVSPEQASELFSQQREQIGEDLGKLQTEIGAIIREAKAEAESEGQEADEGLAVDS